MALKLYMDVHIPAAISEGLRRRHLDVLTSQDDGTRAVDDTALLQRATDLERLLSESSLFPDLATALLFSPVWQ